MHRDVSRMIVHVPPGIVGMVLLQIVGISEQTAWLIFGIVAGVLIGVFDLCRLLIRVLATRHPGKGLDWFWSVEEMAVRQGLLRDHERRGPSSMGWYAVGVCVTYALFSDWIVVSSLLLLACGDPAAGWFGRRTKGVRFRNGKSPRGMLAFCVTGVIVISIAQAMQHVFEIGHPIYPEVSVRLILAQLCGIVLGAVAEAFSGRVDNATISVVAATTMWCLF